MSDDQGFTNDMKTQLIELNYIPTYTPKPIKPKPYFHRLKLKTETNSLEQSVFINQTLRDQLSNKFMQMHNQKIIYNSYKQSAITYPGQLTFQSDFQSGNLDYAIQKNGREYHLFIRPDTNTKTYFQWFYFKVKSKENKQVTLVIKNFVKESMLYRRGLKPYFRSIKNNDQFYEPIQTSVSYQQDYSQDDKLSYSLKFDYKFQQSDQVQFCSQPPYTFSKLQSILSIIPFRKIQISKTIMGHKIQALVINQHINYKAMVVVMARQHPGESVGSWMMEGFIEKLRCMQNNIFWLIIPMVNIDGVIAGNNRTGILGYDFNRNWSVDEQSIKISLFPEIMGIINYFKKARRQKHKKIKLFLDLHGHSSQPNAFCYGPPHNRNSQYFQTSRLFPHLISKANPNFNLQQCSYEIESDKKNCSRSVFYNRFSFPYTYTIQSSFGVYRDKCINQIDLLKMGSDICETTAQFLNLLTDKNMEAICTNLIAEMKKINIQTIKYKQNYQSDQQIDQQDSATKVEFAKKITSIITNPQTYKIQLQKISNKQTTKRKLNPINTTRDVANFIRFDSSTQRSRKHHQRFITQQSNIEIQSCNKRGSVMLPKLEHKIRTKRKLSISIQNPIEEKMLAHPSILQMKNRMFNMKQSTIGKKILILNAYPSCYI